ncbi:MAG TPA: phosphotransferase, partial [Anaerolineales bacterium]|nr:phosphotransferase [Anaerolineales bacterium]
ENYQRYVKNSLPPTTARIQHRPVTVRNSPLAALRYTFIGMPGEMPLSLRLALLEDPDPAWYARLADAYGPNWWMQRSPYTFRLLQEYDRKLPAHLTLRPASGNGAMRLDGRQTPAQVDAQPGEVVHLTNFRVKSANPQTGKFSLVGTAQDGPPPLRVSYFGDVLPGRIVGRVESTRQSFLSGQVAGFDLLGLPDPLAKLPEVLGRTVAGTRSIIHGDLNLENILIGPGETLWLIDFAETREGHPLFDFAHLYVEVIGHVLSQQVDSPQDFLRGLEEGYPLLDALERAAGRYLFDLNTPEEFTLAAFVSCLGAQKYRNLDDKARHLLYLTAAFLSQGL